MILQNLLAVLKATELPAYTAAITSNTTISMPISQPSPAPVRSSVEEATSIYRPNLVAETISA